jgi:WD40 repeat protein
MWAVVVAVLAVSAAPPTAGASSSSPPSAAPARLPFGSCKTPQARATFEAGRKLVAAERADDAVVLLERCLQEDPTCLACQFQLGWAYWVKEDWGLAAVAFDKTLALSPGHAAAKKYAAKAREREGMESEELGDVPVSTALPSTTPSPPTPTSPSTSMVPPPTPTVPPVSVPPVSVPPVSVPPVSVLPPAQPGVVSAPVPPVSLPPVPPPPPVPAWDRARLAVAEALGGPEQTLMVPVGTRGQGDRAATDAPRLQLVARWQGYAAARSPGDHFDLDINSPKSVRFSRDGAKVYVNSLEGYRTVVFDPARLEKIGVIPHAFTKDDAPLFHGQDTVFGYKYRRAPPSGDHNVMRGKPVESALSHGGRYLWVPYYRRDFDRGSTSPSAVAVIDTSVDRIVRVLPTGPIPKYVVASPDDRFLAVTHWGDNTLGIIDISSGDPAQFRYLESRLVVGMALSMEALTGGDRDKECGACLRGTVFSPDGSTLLVAKMGSGGVAAFDTATWTYLGTVTGEKPSPRHLVISRDGRWLYMSANASGFVARAPLAEFLATARVAGGKSKPFAAWQEVHVGGGARTIELSPDDRWLYVACNSRAQVVVVDTRTMRVVHRVRTDAYAVGLAVSPDGSQVWTTSQGNHENGGRSVGVYAVRFGDDVETTSATLVASATSSVRPSAQPVVASSVRVASQPEAVPTLPVTVPASPAVAPSSPVAVATVSPDRPSSSTVVPASTRVAVARKKVDCRLVRPTKVWLRGAFIELPTGTSLSAASDGVRVDNFTTVQTPEGIGRIHNLLLEQRCTI